MHTVAPTRPALAAIVGGPVEYKMPEQGFNGILELGEAPGRDEVEQGKPFVGTAGNLLDSIHQECGISVAHTCRGNVFRYRPKDNDISLFFGPKTEAGVITDANLIGPYTPGLGKPTYLRAEMYGEIEYLRHMLTVIEPTVIVAMGNIAIYALLGITGITNARGKTFTSPLTPAPIVPTFHPASALPSRSPEHRAHIVADFNGPIKDLLQKAGRLAGHPRDYDHPASGYTGRRDQGRYAHFVSTITAAQDTKS